MLSRVLKFTSKIDASSIFFILGFGAFYLSDALIASNGTDQEISQWALLRSFMIISATCALFGMEQLIVREPKASSLILKVSRVHLIIIAVLAAMLGAWLEYVTSFWIGFVATLGVACTNLSFQWFRSNLSITKAYIVNSSWRILFLIGVAVFFIHDLANINTILVSAFIFGSVIVVYLLYTSSARDDLVAIHEDVKKISDVYAIGAMYFLASLSLAIASFGESIVIHHIGVSSDLALYLKAALVFLFPGVIVNQYLAARIGPYVRQKEKATLLFIKAYFWKGILGLFLVLSVLLGFGYVFELLLYGERIVSLELAVILSLTSCIRFLYILPSAFVGVVANRQQLLRTTIGYLICAMLLPILSIVFHTLGLSVVVAVAVANLCNWTVRSLIGTKLIISRLALLKKGEL